MQLPRLVRSALGATRPGLVVLHRKEIAQVEQELLRCGALAGQVIVLAVDDDDIGGAICKVHGRSPAVFARSAALLLLDLVKAPAEWFGRFAAALDAEANVGPNEVRMAIFSHGKSQVQKWRLPRLESQGRTN